MVGAGGGETGGRPGGGAGGEALRLDAVSKLYGEGAGAVAALREVSLVLAAGTFTAVMGPSGSGKSTLLHCASGLDRPTSGQVRVGGQVMACGSEAQAARFRRGRIGFVFQHFNLLPALTVRENIALPARLAGQAVDEARLAAVVERVGLAGRLGHRPGALSGGEQQRVAIARALVTRPQVVFADEPTGALDSHRAGEVLELFGQAVGEFGQTVVMVTHDPVAASHAGRVLFLLDGRIVAEMTRPEPSAVAEQMARLGGQAARRGAGSGV
ncbi:ABC transporter ATP-binding protein [Actinospica robiniae]|uniref:ABC transporter ATP-binding protein n=1 Tax=Actinospica robiniae TaxID=304901 RepID=UPI00041DB94E|nr:ABC transporter ATP-binding protein [Actinospica robiniae]